MYGKQYISLPFRLNNSFYSYFYSFDEPSSLSGRRCNRQNCIDHGDIGRYATDKTCAIVKAIRRREWCKAQRYGGMICR